ncbi:MAG: type II toxin-antitoxin system VapC family toxin, partial [Deltaproteobacteria bacterium]|nr:type II toxin-antitoxin system VapC family toxin [Deltaproteobacteria bacterium]
MLVLDTHAWWWAVNEPGQLSRNAYELLSMTPPDQRAVASISIWEFAMMVKRGRIRLRMSAANWLEYAVEKTGLQVCELTPRIAVEACSLPGEFHKDPADRIIVATARV